MEPNTDAHEDHCLACYNPLSPVRRYTAPFGHGYCITCLDRMLRTSLMPFFPFPPRCCEASLPVWEDENVEAMLSEGLVAELDQKHEELRTSYRNYCSVPTCSAFIKAPHISGNDATCSVCGSVTCVACKAAAHAGECAANEVLQQVLSTARTQGWKRCGACRNMVERIDGCNEMR